MSQGLAVVLKRALSVAWWPIKKSGLSNVMIGDSRVVTRMARMTAGIRTASIPNPATIRGHRFYFAEGSRSSMYDYIGGDYEPATTRAVLETLRPGSTFIDVGAHVGYYTMLAAERVGSRGHVVAFEPHPETFAALRRTANGSDMGSRIDLVNAAVSSADGEMPLFLGSSLTHSLVQRGDRESITVPVTSLDAAAERIGMRTFDLAKIDAEGCELEVLRGMRGLVARSPDPAIIFEAGSREQERPVFGHLARLGFTRFHALMDGGEPQEIAPDGTGLRYLCPNFSYLNVLARKR